MGEAPCEVWFYHLERSSLDQVLPELLERTLARNWRALVRTREADRIDRLDAWLWAYRDDSFLPHAPAGTANDSRQPILLTLGQENPNGAQALFILDDAEPGDLSPFERCVLIFDGRDDSALTAARRRWSALKSEGWVVAYWRQGETRGWERQA